MKKPWYILQLPFSIHTERISILLNLLSTYTIRTKTESSFAGHTYSSLHTDKEQSCNKMIGYGRDPLSIFQ